MSLAVIPAWVAPALWEVEAAREAAHALSDSLDGDSWKARARALDWAIGQFPLSPVTGQYAEPTHQVVFAEMVVADSVAIRMPLPGAKTDDAVWGDAVASVLGWLLGTRPSPA